MNGAGLNASVNQGDSQRVQVGFGIEERRDVDLKTFDDNGSDGTALDGGVQFIFAGAGAAVLFDELGLRIDDPIFADALGGEVVELHAPIAILDRPREDFDGKVGDGEFAGVVGNLFGFVATEENDVGFVVVAGKDAEGFFVADEAQREPDDERPQ